MRDQSENQVTSVWIRHGETRANREHRYLGRTDEALSQEGIHALLTYKEMKCYPEVEYLFASPMKRCLETAEILYPNLSPVVIREWEEIDFGSFEYKNHWELQEDAGYQAWIDSNGALPFPKGESRESFCRRCEKGYERMRRELCRAVSGRTFCAARSGGTQEPARPFRDMAHGKISVGLIVHGGTIMALLSRYYGGGYFDHQVLNGGGYLCRMNLENGGLHHALRILVPKEDGGR